jgi:hypothetical protein
MLRNLQETFLHEFHKSIYLRFWPLKVLYGESIHADTRDPKAHTQFQHLDTTPRRAQMNEVRKIIPQVWNLAYST